ncbi:MAG: CueP family metal-binding protein [Candidatus Heimdallarchaeaceae archaeon]
MKHQNLKKQFLFLTVSLIIVFLTIFLIFSINYNTKEGTKVIYFAPYLTTTHSCYTHTPGCQGELENISFTYSVISNDGKIKINNTVTTGSNGFFELNLPVRNTFFISTFSIINDTVYLTNNLFNTRINGADCITDLQLFPIF